MTTKGSSWRVGEADTPSPRVGRAPHARCGADMAKASKESGSATATKSLKRNLRMTPLDNLITNAIVDSRQGVEGALTEKELIETVDEFVRLNGRRQQSYFPCRLSRCAIRSPHRCRAAGAERGQGSLVLDWRRIWLGKVQILGPLGRAVRRRRLYPLLGGWGRPRFSDVGPHHHPGVAHGWSSIGGCRIRPRSPRSATERLSASARRWHRSTAISEPRHRQVRVRVVAGCRREYRKPRSTHEADADGSATDGPLHEVARRTPRG